jgi:hypothetical protein
VSDDISETFDKIIQIHKVYTRKPHHKNVEQLSVQDQHQLFVPVDDSFTTQIPGNLELPSGT